MASFVRTCIRKTNRFMNRETKDVITRLGTCGVIERKDVIMRKKRRCNVNQKAK